MQIQKPEEEEEKEEASSPLLSKTQVRLKTLSLLSSKESKQEDHQCYGSSSVGSTDLLSRASSSDFCDYIGTESCMDVFDDIYNYNDQKVDDHDQDDKEDRTVVMNNNNNNSTIDHHHEAYYKRKEQRLARIYKKKEYPPPIPLLVRTENLPSHMPWILKRQYTSDRRLILTEEKVRHHEYLRAHRSNGRLTLHLVPMDDDFFPHQDQDQDQELEEENEVVNETSCDENDDGDDNCNKEDDEKGKEICDHEVDEEYSNSNNNNNNNNNNGVIMQGGNSEEKWFDCSSVRTRSACIFSVTVPAIRPVHS